MTTERETHTPAPWGIDYCVDGGFSISGGAEGDQVVIVKRAQIRARRFEFDANARLIATAPDLLSELKYAVETIHALHGDVAWELYRDNAPEMQRILKLIAKAEGR